MLRDQRVNDDVVTDLRHSLLSFNRIFDESNYGCEENRKTSQKMSAIRFELTFQSF